MATLTPIRKNVLVLLDPPSAVSAGGLHLTATVVKPNVPAWGQVVGLGAQVTEVREGNRVLTAPHKGYRYTVGSMSFLVLEEKDVLAKETGPLAVS